MKVLIIGSHPVPQPGFCGVMSLFEARHLAELGHEVRLLIPVQDEKQRETLLRGQATKDPNLLEKLGGKFEISTASLTEPGPLPPADLTIWQSTSASHWEALSKPAKAASTVFSKNFPKFAASAPAALQQSTRHQFGAFDLIACALKEDYHAVSADGAFFDAIKHRIAYVPRGADPRLLSPDAKGPPTIAIDTPNTPDDFGISHFFAPLRRLREDIDDLRIVSLGRRIGLEGAECIPFCRFDQMYARFLNPAWVYCVVDYGESHLHVRGDIHKVDHRWRRKAVYEVQTVEAQMAGCVVVGHRENVIGELVLPGASAELFDSFEDEESIYRSLASAIENFASRSVQARSWAEHNFSWQRSIERWAIAAENLVGNGYHRSPTRKISIPSQFQAEAQGLAKCAEPGAASTAEEEGALAALMNVSRRYVEFGCGRSTCLAARSSAGRVDSIGSDLDLIEKLQRSEELAGEVQSGRVVFRHIDIGPTDERGYPVNDASRPLWPKYSRDFWRTVPMDETDLVFVTGRFKVACAMQAALNTLEHCRIVVQDYDDRPEYTVIGTILEVEHRLGRLAVFRKRAKWSRDQAFAAWSQYGCDPA